MNDFQVKQHLDLIWTWTPNKASITARKNKKEMRSKQISYVVSSRWINVCVCVCGQHQTVTSFHLTSVWMGSFSLAWFDIISCILSNNVTFKWEFENTMQI